MLSIIVPVYNTRTYARNCLRSILDTLERLQLSDRAEVILMDDNSNPADAIPDLFRSFKQEAKCQVMAFRFKKRQHYSRACSVGFSLAAQGNSLLLVSHDMVVTPPYVRTLLAVAALDASYGMVRGTSPHVDMFPEHQVAPPFKEFRSYEDIVSFAEYVERVNGLACVEDRVVCGDSFLMTAPVREKIGVMDGRYAGMLGDIDLGVRAQRAGFKLICAKGAWLHHVGSGAMRDHASKGIDRTAPEWNVLFQSYEQFRDKWGSYLPEQYPGSLELDYAQMRAKGPANGQDFQPELEMEMDEVEVI